MPHRQSQKSSSPQSEAQAQPYNNTIATNDKNEGSPSHSHPSMLENRDLEAGLADNNVLREHRSNINTNSNRRRSATPNCPPGSERLAVTSELHPFWRTKVGLGIFFLVILVIVGAVVGGVLGGRNNTGRRSAALSSNMAASSLTSSTTSLSIDLVQGAIAQAVIPTLTGVEQRRDSYATVRSAQAGMAPIGFSQPTSTSRMVPSTSTNPVVDKNLGRVGSSDMYLQT